MPLKLTCVLFGHQPETGCHGREGEGYFQVISEGIDGIGTTHARLMTRCERCGTRYQVGKIHLPKKVVVFTCKS